MRAVSTDYSTLGQEKRVAVAHSILVIRYHMIQNGTEYMERGSTIFDKLNPQRTQRWLVRRLEQLGFQVNLEPIVAAA